MSEPNIAELRELLAKATPTGPLSVATERAVLAAADHLSNTVFTWLPALLDRIAALEAIEKAAVDVVEGWNICLSAMDDDNQIPGNAWNDFNADFEDLCTALDGTVKEWRTGK